jgi:hypothetical protein
MKKKLRLHPDSLTVESFAAAPGREERGTVVGLIVTVSPTCKLDSCAPWICPT